jgi:hypothetical protein
MDERWFTYKDHATRRETTLKRVLSEKKLTGFGPSNGTEKLGSEWVHAPPAQVMPLLEQVAEGKDRLYGCTQAGCVLVPRAETRTRAGRALQDMVAEKRRKYSKSGEVGDIGAPVVRTRQLSEALRDRRDPLYKRAAAIAGAQNKAALAAEERLDELTERKVALAGAPNGPQKERDERELQQTICRLRGRTIKQYSSPSYTHQDVTGDGRCYLYAVLRAIGLPLSGPSGAGAKANAMGALRYFDAGARKRWEIKFKDGEFADPLDVLENAAKMRESMYSDRGIKYVVKLMRSKNGHEQIAKFMGDPLASVRAQPEASIWSLRPRMLRYIRSLSTASSKAAAAEKEFRTAFRDGKVIVFVWRNIRGQPRHYELILPSHLLSPLTTSPATTPRRVARAPIALAAIADTSAWKRADNIAAAKATRKRPRARADAAADTAAREALSDTALDDSLSRPARRTRLASAKRKANVARKKAMYVEPRRPNDSPPPTTSYERAMKKHQPLHRFHANTITNKGIRKRRAGYDNDKLRVNGRIITRAK